MFQLIASAVSAFNQAVIFAGALVCWGLGGLLVGNAIYWRRHAVAVQGQVIPEKPGEVQEADNHLFTVVGVAFLGIGGALFWFGATAWPITWMTWVVGALLAAHLVWKLRSLFLPRDAALSRTGWHALPDLLRTVSAADTAPADAGPAWAAPARALPPVQRLEELSAPPGSRRERQSRARAQLARLTPLLLLGGVGMIALGAYASRTLLKLEESGLRTTGRVTSVSASTSSSGTTYHPIVAYCDIAGRTIVFRDAAGTNPPTHHVGDRVTVLYQPGDPPRAIIDRGVWNWLPEVVLYLLGSAFVAAGFAAWRGQSAVGAAAPGDAGVRTGQP